MLQGRTGQSHTVRFFTQPSIYQGKDPHELALHHGMLCQPIPNIVCADIHHLSDGKVATLRKFRVGFFKQIHQKVDDLSGLSGLKGYLLPLLFCY